MSVEPEVLTIGHSNHDLDTFIRLLKKHSVTAIADVRSAPYSRHSSHFNREALADALKKQGIAYSYLGSELGGRPDDPSCYDEGGRVRYERVQKTARFRRGIERLLRGARTYRISLMCGERDPTDCHRTFLVTPELLRQGVSVRHILSDGSLELQQESLDRVFAASGMPSSGVFGPDKQRKELQARAARRVAFTDPKRVASRVRG